MSSWFLCPTVLSSSVLRWPIRTSNSIWLKFQALFSLLKLLSPQYFHLTEWHNHIYSSWKCRNHQWVSPSPYISYSVTQQAHPIASTSYMSSLHSYWLSDSSAWISPTHAYFPQASRLILLRLICDHITFLLKTVQCAPIAFIVKPNHLMWLKRTFMVWLLLHFQFFE